MSRPFCPKENCLSKFYANFNRQFIICGVSHRHRHPHFFGLVLLLAFVQILVLIGIFKFLALSVKIVRKIGAFLFLGVSPDFLLSALTIAHSGCFSLFCTFLCHSLGIGRSLTYICALIEITLDLVLNQPDHKLLLRHVVALQIIKYKFADRTISEVAFFGNDVKNTAKKYYARKRCRLRA